jgi:hypothetical protein
VRDANGNVITPASARCCTSDITLACSGRCAAR